MASQLLVLLNFSLLVCFSGCLQLGRDRKHISSSQLWLHLERFANMTFLCLHEDTEQSQKGDVCETETSASSNTTSSRTWSITRICQWEECPSPNLAAIKATKNWQRCLILIQTSNQPLTNTAQRSLISAVAALLQGLQVLEQLMLPVLERSHWTWRTDAVFTHIPQLILTCALLFKSTGWLGMTCLWQDCRRLLISHNRKEEIKGH